MGTILSVVCISIAVALVALEVALALRKDPGGSPVVQLDMPGGEVVKALADKSPRLAAAVAFAVLAGVFGGQLNFSASVTGDEASSSAPTASR